MTSDTASWSQRCRVTMLRLLFVLLASPLSAYVFNAPLRTVRRAGIVSMDEAKLAKRRISKLVTGTNWPPRTEPTPGKGYLFFQGPTPKTANLSEASPGLSSPSGPGTVQLPSSARTPRPASSRAAAMAILRKK